MTIDLPSVKTFVYTAPRFLERRLAVEAMMKECHFENWEYVWGCDSNNYWRTLHDRWIEVLSNNAVPFLVLEDDATKDLSKNNLIN